MPPTSRCVHGPEVLFREYVSHLSGVFRQSFARESESESESERERERESESESESQSERAREGGREGGREGKAPSAVLLATSGFTVGLAEPDGFDREDRPRLKVVHPQVDQDIRTGRSCFPYIP